LIRELSLKRLRGGAQATYRHSQRRNCIKFAT
jgi:hypothetical protein